MVAALEATQALTKPAGGLIPTFKSQDVLWLALLQAKYKQDPKGGRMDYMQHPQVMWNAAKTLTPGGDCEDYAVAGAASLYRSNLAPRIWLLSTQWAGDNRRLEGHSICVWEDMIGQMWQASNWGGPRKVLNLWAAAMGVNHRALAALALPVAAVRAGTGVVTFDQPFRVV